MNCISILLGIPFFQTYLNVHNSTSRKFYPAKAGKLSVIFELLYFFLKYGIMEWWPALNYP